MADLHITTTAIRAKRWNGPDRRRSVRQTAKGAPVAVRFTWELDGRLGAGRGLIRDLSRGGLCMVVAKAPPRYAKLLIEPERDPSVGRLEAAVVWVKRARLLYRRPMLVGVQFSGPCPHQVFARALGAARPGSRRSVAGSQDTESDPSPDEE